MTTASETRRQKGRENRARIEEVREQKRNEEHVLPHKDMLIPGPRVPTNRREMQMHMSGRHPHLFRDPITRSERRAWDKFWKEKGPGLTKPIRKGERF